MAYKRFRMKLLLFTILMTICFPLFGQRTITEKAIYNSTPIDKIWFTERINYSNDTSYFMELELDSKYESYTNGVVIHFEDGDFIVLNPTTTVNKDKYIVTYFYQSQFRMNDFLIEKVLHSLIVGYSINGQEEKIKGLIFMKAFKKLYN